MSLPHLLAVTPRTLLLHQGLYVSVTFFPKLILCLSFCKGLREDFLATHLEYSEPRRCICFLLWTYHSVPPENASSVNAGSALFALVPTVLGAERAPQKLLDEHVLTKRGGPQPDTQQVSNGK